jgi:predicted PurR-regulated permease PerM
MKRNEKEHNIMKNIEKEYLEYNTHLMLFVVASLLLFLVLVIFLVSMWNYDAEKRIEAIIDRELNGLYGNIRA